MCLGWALVIENPSTEICPREPSLANSNIGIGAGKLEVHKVLVFKSLIVGGLEVATTRSALVPLVRDGCNQKRKMLMIKLSIKIGKDLNVYQAFPLSTEKRTREFQRLKALENRLDVDLD